MKKNLLFTLLVATVFMASGAFAQSKLIHYWHFNNGTFKMYTDTIHGVPADYSTISVNKAQILYAKMTGTSTAYNTYIDTFQAATSDYDTVNARMGMIAGNALRPRNPSDSMDLLFYIPSNHYKNLRLTYGTQSSSVANGPKRQIFSYSVDSGATWRTTGLSMASDSAWLVFHKTSITFGTDTTVNNNGKLVFRVRFSGNNTGTSGNNRFDNVTLEGDTVTASGGTNAVAQVNNNAIAVYPNPVNNVLEITSAFADTKTIVIVDATGKTVYTGTANETAFSVNVAALKSGLYMVTVRENATGFTSSSKFIKQ